MSGEFHKLWSLDVLKPTITALKSKRSHAKLAKITERSRPISEDKAERNQRYQCICGVGFTPNKITATVFTLPVRDLGDNIIKRFQQFHPFIPIIIHRNTI